MDLNKIIRELLEERKKLDRIVTSLEQLKLSGNPSPLQQKETRRGRKSMDARDREEVSKRMKTYWASKKKNSTKT